MKCSECHKDVKPCSFCSHCRASLLDLVFEVDQNALYREGSGDDLPLRITNTGDLPMEDITLTIRSPGFAFSYFGSDYLARKLEMHLEPIAPGLRRDESVDLVPEKPFNKANFFLTLQYRCGVSTRCIVYQHPTVVLPIERPHRTEINWVVNNMEEVFGQDNSPRIDVNLPDHMQWDELLRYWRELLAAEPKWVTAHIKKVETTDGGKGISFGGAPHKADALWLSMPASGRQVQLLAKTAVVMGRKKDSDIVLRIYADEDSTPDPLLSCLISRHHARLEMRGGRIYIEDLGTTNRTTVAGAGVFPGTPLEVRHGDEIGMGWKRFFRHGQGWSVKEALPDTVAFGLVAGSGKTIRSNEVDLPVIRLQTRVFSACNIPFETRAGDLLAEPDCPVEAIRLERVNNSCGEHYVVVLKGAGIGGGKDDAVCIPDLPAGAARLWYCRSGFWIMAGKNGAEISKNGEKLTDDILYSLQPDDRLDIDGRTVTVRDGMKGMK